MSRHERIREILAKVPSVETEAAEPASDQVADGDDLPQKPTRNLRKKYSRIAAVLLILAIFYLAYVYVQFLVQLIARH